MFLFTDKVANEESDYEILINMQHFRRMIIIKVSRGKQIDMYKIIFLFEAKPILILSEAAACFQ